MHIRVILKLSMTIGRELVVLHTTPSMFGKFSLRGMLGGSVEV